MSDAGPGPRAVPEEPAGAAPRDPLLRHREGDSEAFAALLAEYRRPVYSYLVRCGVAVADRDDLFQIIFLKIHRAAGQFQSDRPSHPWIFTVVANEVRSYVRRRRVRELVFAPPAVHDPLDPTPDGERAVQARETVAWLEREIQALPLAQREVLVLASLEGRPLAEVAQALAMPLNTVKTHLRRARLALAEKLARRESPATDEARS
jgi:RNA polymerase sigma-70 factor (ECF subfamily)